MKKALARTRRLRMIEAANTRSIHGTMVVFPLGFGMLPSGKLTVRY